MPFLSNFIHNKEKHKENTGVIHFAASKAVGESVNKPLAYYENNLGTLTTLLQELQKIESAPLIFSSSCTGICGDIYSGSSF